jgi:glycosyltransferase involved in cell wall biosynthesis
MRPTVVFASNLLGIGGTEKGMVLQALAMDRERFDVRIVGILGSGEREAQLREAGFRVDVTDGDRARLVEALRGADVVVVLRQGTPEPLLPGAAAEAGVPHLVEWNIFGHVDPTDDEPRFDVHLLISQMILLRYRDRLGGSPGRSFHDRHRVHYLPLDLDLAAHAPERRAARELLGLDVDRPVVGRVGRAGDGKWRNLLVDMVPPLLERVPDAQVLFVGATEAKVARLRRLGVLDRCVLIEPTLDQDRLAAFYAAMDVFVAAAEIGESQGLAIAEAMALGVPVVTCSTPWADNAQIEFVEHGVTGLIANHPAPFAEAVASLLRDEPLRERLGSQAREFVTRVLDPAALARQMERLVESLVGEGTVPDEWSPSPADVEAFAGEYARRLTLEQRPLTTRERAEAGATRIAERWRQTTISVDAIRQVLGRVRARAAR